MGAGGCFGGIPTGPPEDKFNTDQSAIRRSCYIVGNVMSSWVNSHLQWETLEDKDPWLIDCELSHHRPVLPILYFWPKIQQMTNVSLYGGKQCEERVRLPELQI